MAGSTNSKGRADLHRGDASAGALGRSVTVEAFELMIDSVTDAEIIMLDPQGVVRTWNEGARRLTGYTAEEVLGKPLSFFYTEEDAAAGAAKQELDQAAASGRFEGEGWRVKKVGDRFWANVVIQPMFAPGTKALTGFVKIARDLTLTKAAEQQVRVWELMVESSPNAMFMVNHDGLIQRLNRQAEVLFGYDREELVGRPIEMLVPERFRPNHPGFRNGFFKDPRSRAMGAGRDLYGLTKGGVEVPIEIGLNPMETPEGMFVLASIIDISERKAADEVVRRQRDEILELSTPVMQVWDKVLALPIIGTLDSVRAARLTESLLTRIAQDEATIVILDISGVPTIDSLVAQNLFKTISGARLMGAESIISGVRPETAQAMVHLGIDIGALRSRATLRDALQLALRLQAELAFDPHVGLNGKTP